MIHYKQNILSKLTSILWDDQYERVACLIGEKIGDDFLVTDVIPARNEDYRPAEEFFISGMQMRSHVMEAERRGSTLLGVAHSHLPHHPSVPSEADIHYCRHALNAVYHPSTDTLTWFNAKGELKQETVNSPRPRIAPALTPAFA
ncbi:MAG: Mov34/MPN/PAD-1 family protein [Anaerolineaceae bacterium]|nr:Mov34/MPN/PAD-1 family protein [Anaerolineaceae bacterium]